MNTALTAQLHYSTMPYYPAAEPDYPTIIALINQAFRGTGESKSWNLETNIINGVRITDDLLREELAAKPNAHFLAWRDTPEGPILGTVWLDPSDDGIWYLGLLTVRPDLQTQHLGSTLLIAAEDFAKQRGAKRIEMTVVHVRDTLIAWYQRRGYTRTDKTKPFHYGDDRYGTPLRDDLYFVVLEKDL